MIEPDSLANLVTNLNVAKCANAHDAYLEGVNYAVTQLNLANVAMYIDAGKHTHHTYRHLLKLDSTHSNILILGHAGWLGWDANLSPAATLFAQVYNNASQPASLRGLATNVANYNGWSLSSCPSYTSGDSNCDEKRYVNAIAPLLKSAGWDAHFITDTGTSLTPYLLI
jgi:cellulose 1,4-beta-cellobiosidase